MAFIEPRHQPHRHDRQIQRHRFPVEQPQANKVIHRGIGVDQQRTLLLVSGKTHLKAHHFALYLAKMLPGFGGAEIVAAGQLPLRQLKEIFPHKGALPFSGIDQPFDD